MDEPAARASEASSARDGENIFALDVEELRERYRNHASSSDFGVGDSAADEALVMFLELALATPRRLIRALEQDDIARTNLITTLLCAFISVAHTERVAKILAGLTWGRGFVATENMWTYVDDCDARVEECARGGDGVLDRSKGPVFMPVRAYVGSDGFFRNQLTYLLSHDERTRAAFFERLFLSLNHFADQFTRLYAATRSHENGGTHGEDGDDVDALSKMREASFVNLYTHLRLLEMSFDVMPNVFLREDSSSLASTIELIEFLIHRCTPLGVFNGRARDGVVVETSLLMLPIFGICACSNRALSDGVAQRLSATSVGIPDFSIVIEIIESLTSESGDGRTRRRIVFQAQSSAELRLELVSAAKKRARDEIERMAKVPSPPINLEEIAPDAFLDSITGRLMWQPVKLGSGQYVDMSTIHRLRMTGATTDPFTGAPLEFDSFDVDADMKGRIDNWCRENNIQSAGVAK